MVLANSDWLSRLTKVFAVYSSFFRDSSNLADCSPTGPQCSLISSRFEQLSSQNAHNNIYHTISHAFNDIHPFSYHCTHNTPENAIVQPYDAISQYATLHPSYNHRNIGRWNHADDPLFNKGPYWNAFPFQSSTIDPQTILETDEVISNYYYIENPQ
ncbi:hypothetical protein WA026_011777 [Henosepilachna vigintioctopunctata]|uniref:Uncharacterized protein n=1 Tax=Henosepilachna vigintioctopunctata TaxID=420089 RepID=A0AAW1UDD0_9CUCU